MIWLLVSVALADIALPRIGPPCPLGSVESGQQCSPASECDADADCGQGHTCRLVGLCVRTVTVTSRRARQDGGPPDRWQEDDAYGVCTVDLECNGGDRCDMARRCVEVEEPPPPAPAAPEPAPEAESARACGCEAVSGGASGAVGLALLFLAGRRRR